MISELKNRYQTNESRVQKFERRVWNLFHKNKRQAPKFDLTDIQRGRYYIQRPYIKRVNDRHKNSWVWRKHFWYIVIYNRIGNSRKSEYTRRMHI